MSKVTSKLQVTIPKAIANMLGIMPGDELEWIAAGDSLRVLPLSRKQRLSVEQRLDLFDQATRRQRHRQLGRTGGRKPSTRGWKREDLYER